MSKHRVTVTWRREGAAFDYESYPRRHAWRFDGGVEVPASAAMAYLGDADRVDPEEAFVAAVASCHMLSFLAVAARRRLVVDAWEDAAVGFMAENEEGRLAVARVVLRPRIAFGGEPPGASEIERLHARAHKECFIANSVRTEITVESPGDGGGSAAR